jgi:hypothetical protein
MKPGRNDPCPCGSGKKYKQCCLLRDEAIAPDVAALRRVQRATDGLTGRITAFADRHFGLEAIDDAWDEFNVHAFEDDAFDPDSPYAGVFLSWFVHDWTPDPQSTRVRATMRGVTPAAAYLRETGARLDPLARVWLEACAQTPFGFHEVLEVAPERGLRVRDLVGGAEADVTDPAVAKDVQPGVILYGRIVPIEGIAVLEGPTPVALPAEDRPAILELLRELRREFRDAGDELPRVAAADLRELYLSLTDRLLYPDDVEADDGRSGRVERLKLIFDIDDAEEASRALAPLVREVPEAQIRITDRRIEALVDSTDLADRVQAEIESALGEGARFRVAKPA